MKYLILLASFLLTASSTTGIVPMDEDTYMIASKSAKPAFSPQVVAKADIYEEANFFRQNPTNCRNNKLCNNQCWIC